MSTYSSFNHPLCGRPFILPLPRNLNIFAICCPLRGMLVDNNACWCQEYFLETPGRDYSPSTSVDLEREGVVVVFEVVEFRASKSALGVGPKAPTSEDPVPVWYPVTPGRRAWMAPVAATGTAMLETDIFASSICHCNIITLVHVKMLLVGNIGHFDVEIVLARARKIWKSSTSSLCAFGQSVIILVALLAKRARRVSVEVALSCARYEGAGRLFQRNVVSDEAA